MSGPAARSAATTRPARRLVRIGLVGGLVVGAPAAADTYPSATLQGLDKVTARVSTIRAPIGQTVRFEALEIVVRTCDKRPPEDPPEAAAFLEIREARPGREAREVFRGWMFASSPALSAMDHAVYDIWVLDCVSSASTADRESPVESSE